MKESDVRKAGEEKGRLMAGVAPAPGHNGVRNAKEPPKRKTDEKWQAFATEDPAFFIKPSDTV